MKLMRIGEPGAERPVLLTADDLHLDLSALTDDIDAAFLAGGGLDRVRQAAAQGELPRVDVTGQRIGAPIARPSAVLCIGMNYAAHAAETGSSRSRCTGSSIRPLSRCCSTRRPTPSSVPTTTS